MPPLSFRTHAKALDGRGKSGSVPATALFARMAYAGTFAPAFTLTGVSQP
jgi:hypothetical protein